MFHQGIYSGGREEGNLEILCKQDRKARHYRGFLSILNFFFSAILFFMSDEGVNYLKFRVVSSGANAILRCRLVLVNTQHIFIFQFPSPINSILLFYKYMQSIVTSAISSLKESAIICCCSAKFYLLNPSR